METRFVIISGALIILDLIICVFIGVRTKGSARNTEDYFIGGKKIGSVLLLLTAWASFSGAGNFIGQAGRGAIYGLEAYWLWFGEGLLGGIVMGFILAPYLARFKYVSMPHYVSDYLCGGDHYVRRIGGLAALMPNVVWPGAQIMGVAYVLAEVFSIDYRIAVIACGIVFVFYTVNGGLKAVIYADALHGSIQMFFAGFVIFFGLKMVNFDFRYLSEQISKIAPEKWDLFVDKPSVIITSFLTGLVGATSNPIFWNRVFAAKDVKTARKSYGLTFFFNILMVFLIIAIGIATLIYNPTVGDQALLWTILNKMPPFVGVFLAVGVVAACMSCADTHLNCAAANIISDILDPEEKLPPEKGVKYAKIATLIAGIIAIFSGLYAPYIYALGTYGYTICGGVLIPMFVVGLIMRDRQSDVSKSEMDIRSARIGITIGVILTLAFELIPLWKAVFGGGVIPAIIGTVLGIIIPNFFYKAALNKNDLSS
ncbi:sodium:solute symporter family protein [Clostridium formicaceticum]|uniref:Sodium/proline symporter n=1 Tax=Clostridium formicaceticum TaxID=1497 RepID=A0AAC9RPI5_9CLOT|nr:sodium:solute symporter family protein [Clostridium formicaceticum]AOY75312.1 hypothetical protein BJL90_04975 [Clostridium formicaceticum]ARE89756.1 Sodium/proline symporter [Clostridium formicaceticum]